MNLHKYYANALFASVVITGTVAIASELSEPPVQIVPNLKTQNLLPARSFETATARDYLFARHPGLEKAARQLGFEPDGMKTSNERNYAVQYPAVGDKYALPCAKLPQDWRSTLRKVFSAENDAIINIAAAQERPDEVDLITAPNNFAVFDTMYDRENLGIARQGYSVVFHCY